MFKSMNWLIRISTMFLFCTLSASVAAAASGVSGTLTDPHGRLLGEGNIEPREVELGPQVGNEIVVAKGIKAGEEIVTSANFLIRASGVVLNLQA